jgi:hypothetical protein
MSSPFSKKNLPFVIFSVVAVALVFVLVFKPFQSSFGEAPIQTSMSDPTSISTNQIKSYKYDVNPYGSPTLAKATGVLDNVIKEVEYVKPPNPNINNNELNRLYSQLKQTLADAMNYRNNISLSTSADEVLTKSAMLSGIRDSFVSKKRELEAL